MKKYQEWFERKKDLDQGSHKPPELYPGDMFWAAIGENIGHEIDGKNKNFSRPVIIFTKLYSELLFVIPVSSQPHTGNWYVPFSHDSKEMVACLQQAHTIDYRRLYGKFGKMQEEDFALVKEGFKVLHDI